MKMRINYVQSSKVHSDIIEGYIAKTLQPSDRLRTNDE